MHSLVSCGMVLSWNFARFAMHECFAHLKRSPGKPNLESIGFIVMACRPVHDECWQTQRHLQFIGRAGGWTVEPHRFRLSRSEAGARVRSIARKNKKRRKTNNEHANPFILRVHRAAGKLFSPLLLLFVRRAEERIFINNGEKQKHQTPDPVPAAEPKQAC